MYAESDMPEPHIGDWAGRYARIDDPKDLNLWHVTVQFYAHDYASDGFLRRCVVVRERYASGQTASRRIPFPEN